MVMLIWVVDSEDDRDMWIKAVLVTAGLECQSIHALVQSNVPRNKRANAAVLIGCALADFLPGIGGSLKV
jgi:hypothetical protein